LPKSLAEKTAQIPEYLEGFCIASQYRGGFAAPPRTGSGKKETGKDRRHEGAPPATKKHETRMEMHRQKKQHKSTEKHRKAQGHRKTGLQQSCHKPATQKLKNHRLMMTYDDL